MQSVENFCKGAVARAHAGQDQCANADDHDGDLYWTGALWMANTILEYVQTTMKERS
jgi:hypothetical protein